MSLLALKDLTLADTTRIKQFNTSMDNMLVKATDDGKTLAPLSDWKTFRTINNPSLIRTYWDSLNLSEVGNDYPSGTGHPAQFHNSLPSVYFSPPMNINYDGDETTSTSNFDFVLWKKLESISPTQHPTWLTQFGPKGMFAIFYNVATAIKNGSNEDNILSSVLGANIYKQFLQVNFENYLNGQPQPDHASISTQLTIGVTEVPVTYMDFRAFTKKYPQVFHFGTERDGILETLRAGDTISTSTTSDNAVVNRTLEAAALSTPVFEDLGPSNQIGSHFVKKFFSEIQDPNAPNKPVALLRDDYVKSSSGNSSEAIGLDYKAGDIYGAKQNLWSGSPIMELPSHTQVVVYEKGRGSGAIYNKVKVLDEAGEIVNDGFIDSRLLGKFENISLEKFCNLWKDLPVTEVPEPNENATSTKWKNKTECEPYLDEKTNDYCITFNIFC